MKKQIIVFVFLFGVTILLFSQSKFKPKNHHPFIENKGQWPNEGLFLARCDGFNMWITKTAMVFTLANHELKKSKMDFSENAHFRGTPSVNNQKKKEIISVEFLNSNNDPSIEKKI